MSKRAQGIAAAFALFCIMAFYGSQIRRSPSPFLPSEQATNQNQPANAPPKESEKDATDRTIAFYTEVLAWFTGALAISTILLWWTTRRAAITQARDMEKSIDIAERGLVSSRRAFVFAASLDSQWVLEKVTGKPDRYHWVLRVNWLNSGETPSRRLRQTSNCIVLDSPLPDDAPFPDGPYPPGTGLLGPKATSSGGPTPQFPEPPLSPETLEAAIKGEKFIYIGGWVRYFDVFPNTPERITRFCWRVLVVGDPHAFLPGQGPQGPHSLRFDTMHMSHGNCADEECAS